MSSHTAQTELKLIGKLILEGDLTCHTGLHIGAGKGSLEIGGADNPVVKDAFGLPYIPGSSLRGKIRSLLEQSSGMAVPSELVYLSKRKGQEVRIHQSDRPDDDICLLFGRNPGQLARLRQDAALWPNAVDEALRLDPPVLLTGRVSIRTTSVAGVAVPEGAQVVIVLAGANRDPRVFAHPERFDVARENAREHVSFSGGRHYCLGASLARMEGEVGLRVLTERFPELRLLPGARRRPTRVLRGYETLPARLR